MDTSKPASRSWFRVLRPLLWWSVMVLLMFAYRTHQRLSARTTIAFSPTLAGQPVPYGLNARLDDETTLSGQRVTIGRHTLTISTPKTKPFSTNLFIWYGKHDLGGIPLERTMGVLAVKSEPPARLLTIRGPEYSLTLTNSSGMTSSVPTDIYRVDAAYKHVNRVQAVTVSGDQTTVENLEPKVGAVQIECTHPDASYELRNRAGELLDSGSLPTTVTELPDGVYQLTTRRREDQQVIPVGVTAGATNGFRVKFYYGAAVFESEPPGARVIIDGKEYGETPVFLPELKPGAFEFLLNLKDYELVTGSLTVTADQTNSVSTKLVNRYYALAMGSARRLFADREYDRAAEAATEALKHKEDDPEARDLQRDSTGLAHLSRAGDLGRRGDFATGIVEANAALAVLPENTTAQELLADLTNREQQRIEAGKKRAADLAEAQRMREERIAEEEKKRREAEQAWQKQQERQKRLQEVFDAVGSAYENGNSFATQGLAATNQVAALAGAITNSLASGTPTFEIREDSSPQEGIFVIKARQGISVGYRECLIVAAQVGQNETRILFKVFEYENPPKLNLLGGLLKMTAKVMTPPNDAKAAQEKDEMFERRVKMGMAIVEERIQNAIIQVPAAKQ